MPPTVKLPGELIANPGPIQGADRDRWIREKVDITILGQAVATIPRVGLFGHIDHAEFRESFCVVISDEGRVELRSESNIDTLKFDADVMRRNNMGLIASWALEHLTDNPDSRFYNGVFRATLLGATTPPSQKLSLTTETAKPMHIVTVDCTNVVIGDRANVNLTERHHEQEARLSFATLLPTKPKIVRSLAVAIANPEDPAARQDLENRVANATSELPDNIILSAAEFDGRETAATIDVKRTSLTAKRVTAALIGSDTSALQSAEVTVEETVIAGVWPAGTIPEDDTPPSKFTWNDLTWIQLDAKRRRRL